MTTLEATRASNRSQQATGWGLPLKGRIFVISEFGPRRNKKGEPKHHAGLDLRAAIGSDVLAAATGKVVKAGNNATYGNVVVVDHQNGWATLYAHLDSLDVSAGDIVQPAQRIGLSGDTGAPGEPHLHFELLKLPQEPLHFVPGDGRIGPKPSDLAVDPLGYLIAPEPIASVGVVE